MNIKTPGSIDVRALPALGRGASDDVRARDDAVATLCAAFHCDGAFQRLLGLRAPDLPVYWRALVTLLLQSEGASVLVATVDTSPEVRGVLLLTEGDLHPRGRALADYARALIAGVGWLRASRVLLQSQGRRKPTGGRTAWVRNVAVAPAWQGHGVGSALLDAAVRHAANASTLALEVEARNPALRLYRRCGFVATRTGRPRLGSRDRWTLMTRRLAHDVEPPAPVLLREPMQD